MSPECLGSEDCGAGLCIDTQCQSFCAGDQGCREGQACVLGLCRPDWGRGWECVEPDDCAEREDCVSGTCLRRCLRDAHCEAAADVECAFGYCGLPR